MGTVGEFFSLKHNTMRTQNLLTRADVADLLNIRTRAVGSLPGLTAIRINSRLIRYRREDVVSWLEKNASPSKFEPMDNGASELS